MLRGKVLITGGAGFLSRAIYRRAQRENWPVQFTCVSRDDAKHAALQRRYPHVRTKVADVALTPVEHLTDLFLGFDTVIHAAAWKYVDRGESEATAVIETNVVGTMNVITAAQRARVQTVVAISTDKAVMPVNTYGASKFLMERAMQDAAKFTETRFVATRYGNVAASTGSVLETWSRDVREGKTLRVTDPDMTRFWMSADEAIDCILAAMVAPTGSVVVPTPRSMTMRDMALMSLGHDTAGREAFEAEIAAGHIEVMGIRPGEKRHEALLQRAESVRTRRDWRPVGIDSPWPYHLIQRPDVPPVEGQQPYEITSDQPPGGWLPLPEMRAIVRDALEV